MPRMSLRLTEEQWAEVDRARGDVPRERWVRAAVDARLNPSPGHVQMTVNPDRTTTAKFSHQHVGASKRCGRCGEDHRA